MNSTYQYVIFDLDDTLYPRNNGLMQEIGRRIQQWLQQTLDLTQEEAREMRQRYVRQYSTTLAGLMAESRRDARATVADGYVADGYVADGYVADYLQFVHDIPLQAYLEPNPALKQMLQTIPLRKAIYTNGTSAYARRVLQALSVIDHFERIIGIEEVGLRNKTDRRAYEQALEILEAPGSACIMVEDTANNLAAAKTLGMTTILVDGSPDANVDISVDDVLKVGPVVNELLNGSEPRFHPF